MGTRVPINNYDVENNSHNVDNNNLRSADSYIDESNLDDVKNGSEIDRISNGAHDALTQDSLDQDEGSNNGVKIRSFLYLVFNYCILFDYICQLHNKDSI